jgi:hypothetical protein
MGEGGGVFKQKGGREREKRKEEERKWVATIPPAVE